MKKKLLSILLVAVMLFCLAACGGESTPASESKPAESSTKTETPKDNGKKSSTAIPVSEEDQTVHNGATVLHADSIIEVKDEYLIDDMYVEILTDRAMDRTWEYYYTNSAKDMAPIITYKIPEGSYATAQLILECTNLSEEAYKFGDMATATIVFDEGGENEKIYEGHTLQENPGQLFEEYYERTRSTEYIDVEQDESIYIGFLFDVDKEFHDAMVAEEILEPTWAYVVFEREKENKEVIKDTYCVNLRQEMIIFGYDDSDPESQITNDVHKTMAAVAGEFGPEFDVKVWDIWFEDEETATVFCTVVTPDDDEMYGDHDFETTYIYDEDFEVWEAADAEAMMTDMRNIIKNF